MMEKPQTKHHTICFMNFSYKTHSLIREVLLQRFSENSQGTPWRTYNLPFHCTQTLQGEVLGNCDIWGQLEFLRQRRHWWTTPGLLPGNSHGRRSLVGCSPWGRWESDTTERLHFHFSLSCTGEGNGIPLQCSCLENPRDGEPGGLPSMGSHRVGHDWSDLAAAAKFLRNEFWLWFLYNLKVSQ